MTVPRLSLALALWLALGIPASARTWARTGDATRSFNAIAALDDGGAIASWTRARVGDYRQKFVRLDGTGQATWELDVDPVRGINVGGACAAPGGAIFLGRTFDEATSDGDAFVTRVNADGTIAWQVHAPGSDIWFPHEGVFTSDGTLVTCGEIVSLDHDRFVMAHDPSTGLPLWSLRAVRQFTSVGSAGDCAIGALPDGAVRIVTNVSEQVSPTSWKQRALVLDVSRDGQVTAQHVLAASGGSLYVRAGAATNEGGLVALAQMIHDDGRRDAVAWLMSAQGNVEWSRLISHAPPYLSAARDIAAIGGGYVLAEGDSLRSTTLLKLKWDGSPGWSWASTNTAPTALDAFGDGCFAVAGLEQFAARVDDRGEVRASCPNESPSDAVVSEFVLVRQAATTSWEPWLPLVEPFPAVVTNTFAVGSPCARAPCPPLSCAGITSGGGCGEPRRLELELAGGEVVTVEWDLDGDTVADAVGNPIVVRDDLQGRVTARARDACPEGVQSCESSADLAASASAPGEVSDVRAGAPPLLVRKSPGTLRFEELPAATRHSAHVDRIGSWWSPTIAEGTACDAPWTSNGDGTATILLELPEGSWVVVVAGNGCGEGLAGRSSFDAERSDDPAWIDCP